MQFSKISVAAISMAIFSLASAAPTTGDNAVHIEARANCFGEAVAKGAQCVASCVGKSGASDVSTPLSDGFRAEITRRANV